MIYGSVCSGIEAASVAWGPLGWKAAFLSEIEKFPSEVLAHHYPDVPNLGDMTKFKDWPDATIDILVGGTPCQSFSVAGLRKGLADPRGNLALTYLAIADRYRPRYVVWENVPGVLSSDGGRDFGAFLAGLGQLGYGWCYRVLDAQYVRVDGLERAVPQRRRRVFVVGYLGDWRRAAAVLSEPESVFGHTAPRRKAGQVVAPTISARPTGGGGLGTDFDCDGGLISSTGNVAHCLNAGGMGRQDYETETMIAHSLRGEGFDASEDGTGRGTPIVPVEHPCTLAIRGRNGGHDLEYRQDGTANAVLTPNGGRAGIGVGAIAFNSREDPEVTFDRSGPLGSSSPQAQAIAYGLRSDASRSGEAKTPSTDAEGRVSLRDTGFNVYEEHAPTLDAGAAHSVAHAIQAGAFRENPSSGPDGVGVQEGISYTLEARAEVQAVSAGWAVRRLTPTECERLQGFKDGYTAILRNGKPAADGPRYKALGNSMAVNCMAWIGQRIEMVERIASEIERERAA
ncbi:DNA (cytosine-5-)-methyltransferase [Fulvimarina sp. 2208YS6-2-32]|uniref:Cytosine-specific methyltransferase n=1 Tax=Fulvimarina uroteuthidis TaxID=3098149 RepID=A0ABU5HZW7_9HYPH|nr:DNA (cytosine-5-)-methyltransferase [Fulvimarina sp. 2208YS6-2-32]MDY8108273.1 DNA (cytosine-5-)-methyltransferase [Fulvimarina sp. 2208YS6-2-32]